MEGMHSILDSLILPNSISIPIWAYDFLFFPVSCDR
jgi:hypothetical protein